MDFNTFLDHFDPIAEAPGGIAKLRALILDLAVRGKLVPQNPENEPAQELILKNKKLIVETANGKKREIPILQETERTVPRSWFRCQLADIALIEMGNSPSGDTYNENGEGVPLINGPVEFSPGSFGLTVITKYTTAPSRMCKKGDLLVCVRGATTGRTNIAAFDACIGRGVALVRGWEAQNYLNYLLWHLGEQLLQQGKGTTFPSISYPDLGLEVLLPPLAEQKRIVGKVDELMALCDRLAAAKQTRDDLRQKLRGSAIAALMNAETDEALEKSWAIVRDNWQTLSQDPKDVDDLRRSILQLAVRGKLVPQNPEDETAQKLLLKIATIRKELVQNGIKGLPKTISSIDECLDELPSGWQWIQIGDLMQKLGAGSTPKGGKQVYVGSGIKFIRSQNVWNNGLLLDDVAYISPEIHQKMNNTVVQPGDVLLNITGASIGRSALVSADFDEANVSQHVAIVRPILQEMNQWIHLYLISPMTFGNIMDVQVGISREGLSMTRLKDFFIPLPPLFEQKRIVVKVDELMQMCDQLEVSLRQSQQRASALAASAISHLTI